MWETEQQQRDCSLRGADAGGIPMQTFMPPLAYSETWSFRRAEPTGLKHESRCHERITTACSVHLRRILCRGGARIWSFRNKMSHTSRIVMEKALPVGSAFRLAGLCRYPGAGISHEHMRRSGVSAGEQTIISCEVLRWGSLTKGTAVPSFSLSPSVRYGMVMLYPNDGGQAARLNVPHSAAGYGKQKERGRDLFPF